MSELKNQELPPIGGFAKDVPIATILRKRESQLSAALNELKAKDERFAYFQRLTCEQHERDVQEIVAKDTELAAKDARIAGLEKRVHNDGLLILRFSDEITGLDKTIAELESNVAFAGEIMGKVCVYGTLVSGERPINPPPHAAIDAILNQIERAESAESKLGAVSEVLKEKLEKYSSSRRVYFYRGPDVDDIFTRARSIVEGK